MYMNCVLFKDMKNYEVDEILNDIQIKKINHIKDSHLFERNDAPSYLYILVKGTIQLEKIDVNGKKSIVDVFKKCGTVFGEVYLYLNKNYDYTCVLLENSEILAIPKNYFDINRNSNEVQLKLSRNMLEILSQKAYQLNQKLLILSSFSLRQKIANYLIQRLKKEDVVILDLNRSELAEYIGTTRPSLSRELKCMQEDDLIEIDKDKIFIRNINYLKEIL